MENSEIHRLARQLHEARNSAEEQTKLSETLPFEIPAAYQIQNAGLELRVKDGENFIGYKMGLTSEGKRKQMGLDSPVYGVLTDRMSLDNSLSLAGSIHPKIEPEVAFKTNRELRHPVSIDEACDAISEVYPAMEILDSRYKGFKYFSLEDVVADNSSSFKFVLGAAVKADKNFVKKMDLKLELSVNGDVSQEGSTSAISGNPIESVIQLAELLSKYGDKHKSIPKNCIILAGAATAAVSLEKHMTVTLTVENLGSVSLKID